MSDRKGFRAFWRAEGALGHAALDAAGVLLRSLFDEMRRYAERWIGNYKLKKDETKGIVDVSGCADGTDCSGTDRI